MQAKKPLLQKPFSGACPSCGASEGGDGQDARDGHGDDDDGDEGDAFPSVVLNYMSYSR